MATERTPTRLPSLFRLFRGGSGSTPSNSATDLAWRELLEALDIIVWTATPEYVVEYVSPRAERLFGWSLADWTQSSSIWRKLIHPEDYDRVQARREALLEAEESYALEYRVLTKDGQERRVQTAVQVEWQNGEPLRLHGAVMDVTYAREPDSESRTLEERLHSVFDYAGVMLLVHDTDGRVHDANATACQSLGWERSDLIGTTISQHHAQFDETQTLGAWSRLAIDGSLVLDAEYRRRDGSTFPVEIRHGLFDWAGAQRILAIARDTSERKRLEQQLRHSQKMEAVGRLAGGVAHDFNNLLTAIKGHADLLLQDAATEQIRSDLLEITNAADRAAGLTRKLLAFSRQQIFAPEILDLNRIVVDASRLLRPLIGEHIEFKTEMGSVGRVRADHGQIEQVIVNLVVNAKDAMPSGGQLTIATTSLDVDAERPFRHVFVRNGRYVVLRVTDTGVGMDERTLKRIFEPFFTTKPKGKGSGLGLAIAYGIIKQSGGYLIAESEPGRGATFLVILPRTEATEPFQLGEIHAVPAGNGGGRLVLVLEDESPVRSLVSRVLAREGFRVLEAGTGEEALRRAHESREPVELLLADVVLPDTDGREVARRLLAENPQLRVLLMSGYSEELPRVAEPAALEAPRLHKPFTPTELASRVHEAFAT